MENKAAPSFFKIMFGDFSTATTLRIPPAFVKLFDPVYPQVFVVTTHDGRWRVTVIEVGDKLYFEAGWSTFLKDKSVRHGDFLVFTYVDKLELNVKIFKRTGCIEDAGGGKTDSTGEELDASGPCNDSEEENSESFQDDELERPRSKEPELAENFSSEYPFFKVALKRTYVNKKGFLHIPCGFSEQHPNLDLTSRHASLQVSDRRWPVNILLIEGTTTLRICGGWRAFVKDNHLRENDVCIFELVEMNDIVLNVSFIRSIQGRN